MKKKKLFILLAVLGLLSSLGDKAVAQAPLRQHHFLQSKDQLFGFQNTNSANSRHRLFLPFRNGQEKQKPTQIKSRMKSLVMSEFDTLNMAFSSQDSIRFFWIGTNHQDNLDRIILQSELFYPGYSFFFTPFDLIVKADSFQQYSWDNDSLAYETGGKETSILDVNGNLLSQTSFNYNGVGWDASEKTDYTYDTNGNLVTTIDQEWGGSAWENSHKTLYSYDANNRLIGVVQMNWDDVASNWVNAYKYILSYDNQNNLISEIDQNWDSVNTVWTNSEKYAANYTNSLLTSEVDESWNSVSSQWENEERANYSYNSSGKNTGVITQDWDGSTWSNDQNYAYTYVGELVQTVTASDWIDSVSQFVNMGKLSYTYNNYNQCTSAEVFEWDGSQWTHEQNDDKYNFSYEEFDDGTSIKNTLSLADFQLYPNPVNKELNIKISKGLINDIRIVDLNGKVVFTSKSSLNADQVTIPTNQLANGEYYIQIKSGTQQGVRSFVVIH